MVHGHGDDAYRYNREIRHNFSSNVRTDADVSGLMHYLSGCTGAVVSYPDPEAKRLSAKIASAAGIDASCVGVTNGAIEAIYLIALAWRACRSAVVVPTFTEYADACRLHAHRVNGYSAGDFQEDRLAPDEDLVWLCNPNNPDGRIWKPELLRQKIRNHPQQLFIIDQSYEAFIREPLFRAQETVIYPNVITLHSMTKNYRIAGLRLGYVVACPELIRRISQVRMPWSVNGMAIAAGEYLVGHPDNDSTGIYRCLEESQRLQQRLSGIDGITVVPSDTHFFLVRLERGTSAELKTYLAENYGVLIRDASNFSGLDNRYIRLSAQRPDENDLLVDLIRRWMQLI